MKETFNILSLSGGGIKGIFQSTFLKCLENEYQVPLSEVFDLVAGTSTGSIVGAALACNITMDQVTKLYKEHGKSIFKKKPFGIKYLRTSWYSNEELKLRLQNVFGKKEMKDTATRLLIPTTSLENYKYSVFTQDNNETIVDALMSSAAAPFYFDAYRMDGEVNHYYMDGGLWANNPTLLAVLYCINELDIPLDRIRILSLGTSCFPDGDKASRFNSLMTFSTEKIRSVISAIFNSSESFTHEYSECLVKESRIIHIDPSHSFRSKVDLDDVETAINELPLIADNTFRNFKDKLLELFGFEGRTPCSLKRGNFISESSLLKAGIADFIPTRNHYRESDKSTKVSEYLGTVEKSLRIVSVSLCDGINYHGLLPTLEDLLKKNKELTLTISLLNFQDEHLVHVMSPILNVKEDELIGKIKSSVKSIFTLSCKYDKRIRLYLHNTIPFGTIIAIDENLPS